MTAENSQGVVLAPCPHCGNPVVEVANNESKEWGASRWWVHCCKVECYAQGPSIHDGSEEWFKAADRTAEECTALAIAAWNRRAALRTPASTGEGEVRKALETIIHQQSRVDATAATLLVGCAQIARAALAALPPSSGWEAGAKAMREVTAAWLEANGRPVAADHVAHLPLPPPPSREGV